MKKLNIMFALVSLLLLVASCGKKVEVSFSTNTVEIAPEGGSVEISVISNGDWTIGTYPNWISISGTSGTGDATLTLTASTNNGTEARSSEIRVSSKDNSASLTVKQEAMSSESGYLRVTPDHISCIRWGGTFEINVESNLEWSLTGLPNWLAASATEGSNDSRIELTVALFDSDSEERQATLVFAADGLEAQVTVKQSNESGYVFSIDPMDIEMTYPGGTGAISVTSTISWTATTEADWITFEPALGDGNAEVTVNVAENIEYVSREERIRFDCLVPNGSIESLFVWVRQDAAPDPHFLTVDPQEFSFEKDGGTAEITISCDVDWNADLQSEWVSLSASSGTGNTTVVLTVAPNIITEPRSFEFWISSGNLRRNVTVTQEAGDEPPAISLSPDTLYTAYTGSVETLNVTANVSWVIETPASWIYMVTNSGNGNGIQNIIVDINNSPTPRTTEVRAIYNNQIMDKTIVVQEAKPIILETDINAINATALGGQYTINITSTLNWRLDKGANWVHYSPSSGSGNGQVVFTIDPMLSTHDRTTEVLLLGDYDTQITITISQRN
jgi:hypothetical protein